MRGPLSTASSIAGLYAILDFPIRHALTAERALGALLAGGAAVIQLRSKHAPLEPGLVRELATSCAERGVPLIINDQLELLELGLAGVAGVHLGQSDLPRLGSSLAEQLCRRAELREAGVLIGISTHDLTQLEHTLSTYAPDYVGFGPVFATQSKAKPEPCVGLDGLTQACRVATVPVVAIGGLTLERLGPVARAGARAFAVISALAAPEAEQIRAQAIALRQAFALV